MKFDQDALLAGIDAFNDVDYILAKSSTAKLQRAIAAYCEATNTVLVPRDMRDRAASLLMGLSAYWDEQGDTKQAEYIESVAKALTQEAE